MTKSQDRSKKREPDLSQAPDPSSPNYRSLLHQWNAAADRIKVLETKLEQMSPFGSDRVETDDPESISIGPSSDSLTDSTQRYQPSVLHSQRPDRADNAPRDPIVRLRRRRRSKLSGWKRWAQKSVVSFFQF